MPDIPHTFILDDDDLTSASLQTPSTNVEAGVNGIMSYGASEGALNFNHVDTLVIETGITDSTATNTLFISGSGTHTYPVSATFYANFGTDGAVDREVIGIGGGTYLGTDQLVFAFFPSFSLGMDEADRIAGILVLLNVVFETFDLAPSDTGNPPSIWCMTCIQFSDTPPIGPPTWFTIPRTERFMERRTGNWVGPSDVEVYQDIPTRCLITAADLTDAGLDPTTDTIGAVRAMVSLYVHDLAGGGTPSIELNSCQMTIIPLHAELVT